MTILILDSEPKKIAEMLDDKSLDKMIKSVAFALVTEHFYQNWELGINKYAPPIAWNKRIERFSENKSGYEWWQWASTCIANYRYLVELAEKLCEEHSWRFSSDVEVMHNTQVMTINKGFKVHKLYQVISWCRDNEPDLPNNSVTIIPEPYNPHNCPEIYKWKKEIMTPFPLVMPQKFQHLDITNNTDKEMIVTEEMITCSMYRYYYKHLVEKMERPKDVFIKTLDDCESAGFWKTEFPKVIFTRRSPPEFLR